MSLACAMDKASHRRQREQIIVMYHNMVLTPLCRYTQCMHADSARYDANLSATNRMDLTYR